MASLTPRMLERSPAGIDTKQVPWERGHLPAKFVSHPALGPSPNFVVYRLKLDLAASIEARIHVSADERYTFFVGDDIGRGPERGDPDHWYFDTYDLHLEAGAHTLWAIVYSLGQAHAPFAQLSVQHGFLVCSLDPKHAGVLNTGKANWESARVDKITMIPRTAAYGCGDRFDMSVPFMEMLSAAKETDFVPASASEQAYWYGASDVWPDRQLRPAKTPPMLMDRFTGALVRYAAETSGPETYLEPIEGAKSRRELMELVQSMINGDRVTLPRHKKLRVIVDLQTYLCAYWQFRIVSGGKGLMRITWEESLYHDLSTSDKRDRNQIEGKFFGSVWHKKLASGDLHRFDAPGLHGSPWWMAGRYVEIYIETGPDAVIIEGFQLTQTGFPFPTDEAPFRCSDSRLNEIADMCRVTLRADAHDQFCDSPYYEQLQYVGDTRIQALMTHYLVDGSSIAEKAVALFGSSIRAPGLTQSRYPSRNAQRIPPFSLFWVMMVRDLARHRGLGDEAGTYLAGTRAVLTYFEKRVDAKVGLFKCDKFWNFLDWIDDWPAGEPPGANSAFNLALNLQFVLALEAASELEAEFGGGAVARHYDQLAQAISRRVLGYANSDKLLPDSTDSKSVCEHTHILAALCRLPKLRDLGRRAILGPVKGHRATYYFQFYRFLALEQMGKQEQMVDEMKDEWGKMIDLGLKACPERPEPTRSDCHAWSAHPLWFFQRAILGLRQTAPAEVEFAPNLMKLKWAEGFIATGRGSVHVRLEQNEKGTRAVVKVPSGVTVRVAARSQTLESGVRNEIWL